MYKVRKINRKIYFFLLPVIISILITSCAATKESISSGQIIIREQGSFAVGGSGITSPGTFDPVNHGHRHGGDVTLVHLPEIGIKGNTHFPMSDLNNLEIADHLSGFFKKKNLD